MTIPLACPRGSVHVCVQVTCVVEINDGLTVLKCEPSASLVFGKSHADILQRPVTKFLHLPSGVLDCVSSSRTLMCTSVFQYFSLLCCVCARCSLLEQVWGRTEAGRTDEQPACMCSMHGNGNLSYT